MEATSSERMMASCKEEDRFSKLPEPLIVEILSLLELKEAVKTSVLAKDWKNLWKGVNNIVVRCDDEGQIICGLSGEEATWISEIRYDRWIPSIDRTLEQCTTVGINRFGLILGTKQQTCRLQHPVVIGKWIPYALDRDVQIVELSHFHEVPECILQSSSMTTLELSRCGVSRVSSAVNMNSLKNLRLESLTTLDEQSLENLIMGCPVLQNLDLVKIDGIKHINIMSPSVKRFTLNGFENGYVFDFVKIKAPWLQELEIWSRFVITECEFVDVSSLKKATLTFHTVNRVVDLPSTGEEDWDIDGVREYIYLWIPMVTQLLDSLSCVGELTIGSEPIQVLTLSKVLSRPSPLFKCKHLSIEASLWKFDLPGIVCLLENAPHLETLFIKVLDEWQDRFPIEQTEELFEDENPHLRIPKGNFLHLKNIMIDYWRYPCCDDTESSYGEFFDFELVDYMLRSGVVLEQLILCSSSRSCRHKCPEPNCAFQYVPRLSENLIANSLGGNEAATKWELKRCKNKFVFTFSN